MNATPTEWQPIETVPNDRAALLTDGVIVWITHHPHMSRARGKATHWMPLPDPPQAIGVDGGQIESPEAAEPSDP